MPQLCHTMTAIFRYGAIMVQVTSGNGNNMGNMPHKAKYSDVDIQSERFKMIGQIHQQPLTKAEFKRKGVSLLAFCPINRDTDRQGRNTSNVVLPNDGNGRGECLETGMLSAFSYENLAKTLLEAVLDTSAQHGANIKKVMHATRLECVAFTLD